MSRFFFDKEIKKAPILSYESFVCPRPDSNQHTREGTCT